MGQEYAEPPMPAIGGGSQGGRRFRIGILFLSYSLFLSYFLFLSL
jgi:hypothetical protein